MPQLFNRVNPFRCLRSVFTGSSPPPPSPQHHISIFSSLQTHELVSPLLRQPAELQLLMVCQPSHHLGGRGGREEWSAAQLFLLLILSCQLLLQTSAHHNPDGASWLIQHFPFKETRETLGTKGNKCRKGNFCTWLPCSSSGYPGQLDYTTHIHIVTPGTIVPLETVVIALHAFCSQTDSQLAAPLYSH